MDVWSTFIILDVRNIFIIPDVWNIFSVLNIRNTFIILDVQTKLFRSGRPDDLL